MYMYAYLVGGGIVFTLAWIGATMAAVVDASGLEQPTENEDNASLTSKVDMGPVEASQSPQAPDFDYPTSESRYAMSNETSMVSERCCCCLQMVGRL